MRGTEITVERHVGETAFLFLEQVGAKKFRVRQNIYAEVCQKGNKYIDIYQARQVLEGKKLQRVKKEIVSSPRMRRILTVEGRKSVEILSKNPIMYQGEVAIMDYVIEGCKYFILTEKELKQLEEENLKPNRKRMLQVLERKGIDMLAGEFLKFSFIGKLEEKFSVVYPLCVQDLLHHGETYIPKVLFEGNKRLGIEFLSGWTAGHLSPKYHTRIKLIQTEKGSSAYLMPDKNWADETRDHPDWRKMFEEETCDGIKEEVIEGCHRIVVSSYNMNGFAMKERIVYYVHNETAFKEILK